jgi:hypothetical protein
MTKNVRDSEILISILLTLLGIGLLYLIYIDFTRSVELNKIYSWYPKMTIGEISRLYHLPIIISVMLIISGPMLMMNKFSGWYTAFVSCVFLSLIMGLIIIFLMNSVHGLSGDYWMVWVLGGVFIVLSIVLITKPFRLKYQVNRKSWLMTAGLARELRRVS